MTDFKRCRKRKAKHKQNFEENHKDTTNEFARSGERMTNVHVWKE